jgi:hypothetical protein
VVMGRGNSPRISLGQHSKSIDAGLWLFKPAYKRIELSPITKINSVIILFDLRGILVAMVVVA